MPQFPSLPLPLAQLLRRAENAKTAHVGHQHAFHLWEAGIKLLAAAAIVHYAEQPRRDEGINERLRMLARPSLGHWWEFVRTLIQFLAEQRIEGYQGLSELLFGAARNDLPRCRSLQADLRSHLGGGQSGSGHVRVGELFELLIRYRNREAHGAAGLQRESFYQAMRSRLSEGAAELFPRLDFFGGGRFVYVGEVRLGAEGTWLVDRYELTGEAPARLESLEFAAAAHDRLPIPDRVYLQSERSLLSLHPLLMFAFDADKVYFLNGRRGRGDADYLCYTSGEQKSQGLEHDQRELLSHVLGLPVTPQEFAAWQAEGYSNEQGTEESTPAPTSTTRREGERWVDGFRLIGKLGQGGMGTVWRAWQESLGREVALKTLNLIGDERAERRFAREILALGRVEHPHLVKVYASGVEGDQCYYAMELVEGADLGRVFDRLAGRLPSTLTEAEWHAAVSTVADTQAESKGDTAATSPKSPPAPPTATPADAAPHSPVPIPHSPPTPESRAPSRRRGARGHVRQVVAALADVADAAHALHEAGVVHRDIKPGNVMLTRDGQAILMDLGLAQLLDDDQGRLTRTRQFVGTLRFASPEQVIGSSRLDRRSDIYSLGATLWELLTLRPIYGATDDTPTPELMNKIPLVDPGGTRRHNPQVPEDLDWIIGKCLRKDASDRYSTSAELAEDLRRFLADEPVLARPPSLGYVVRKFARRNRWTLAAVGLATLLLIAGGAAWVVSMQLLNDQLRRTNDALINYGDFVTELRLADERVLDELERLDGIAAAIESRNPEDGRTCRALITERFADRLIKTLPEKTTLLSDEAIEAYRGRMARVVDYARERRLEHEPLRRLLESALDNRQSQVEELFRLTSLTREGLESRQAGPAFRTIDQTFQPQGEVSLSVAFARGLLDAPAIGVLLNASDRSAYLFALASSDLTRRDIQRAQFPESLRLRTARERSESLEALVLRIEAEEDGLLRAEAIAQAPIAPEVLDENGPLTLTARRSGDELRLSINQRLAARIQDPFPLPSRADDRFGVYWPGDVEVASASATRLRLAEQSSALERGDDLYSQFRFEEAEREYREALRQLEEDKACPWEAQYKLACVHEVLGDEYLPLLEEIAAEPPVSEDRLAERQWYLCALAKLLNVYLERTPEGAPRDTIKAYQYLDSAKPLIADMARLVPAQLRFAIQETLSLDSVHRFVITFDAPSHLSRLRIAEGLSVMTEVDPARRRYLRWRTADALRVLDHHDEAADILRSLIAEPTVTIRERNALVSDLCWTLLIMGKVADAKTALAPWLADEHIATHYPLLIDRARVELASGNRDEAARAAALADLEQFLERAHDGELPDDAARAVVHYAQFADACLLKGFLLRSQGDLPGAEAAWKHGLRRNWRGRGADYPTRDEMVRKRGVELLQTSQAFDLGGMVISLTKTVDDDEPRQIVESLVSNTGIEGDAAISMLRKVVDDRPQLLRYVTLNCHTFPDVLLVDGRSVAERLVFRECDLDEFHHDSTALLLYGGVVAAIYPDTPYEEIPEQLREFAAHQCREIVRAYAVDELKTSEMRVVFNVWNGAYDLKALNRLCARLREARPGLAPALYYLSARVQAQLPQVANARALYDKVIEDDQTPPFLKDLCLREREQLGQ